MKQKLDIMATIKDGVALGFVNFLSIIATVLLYIVSLIIPYINVGTTIAVSALPAEMAKGKMINPLYIFQSKYRRNMGEFLILEALKMGALSVAFLFLFFPGMVISIAWSFAEILFVDQDKSPMDALCDSNKMTYGNKWRIFWINTLLGLFIGIAALIIIGICAAVDAGWLTVVGAILVVLLALFFVPAVLGVQAAIYKKLSEPEAPEAAE